MTGRGLRGRRQARMMLVAALIPGVLTAFLLVAQPSTMGPPASPFGWGLAIIGLGLAGYAVGFGWMLRLYPRDPEAHPSWWRFERF